MAVLAWNPSEWKTSRCAPGLGREEQAEELDSAWLDARLAGHVERWDPGFALGAWLGLLPVFGRFSRRRLLKVSSETSEVRLVLTRDSVCGSFLSGPVIFDIPSYRYETPLLFFDPQRLGGELFR